MSNLIFSKNDVSIAQENILSKGGRLSSRPNGRGLRAERMMKKKLEFTAKQAEQCAEELAAALRSTVMTVEELSEGLLAVGKAMLKRYRWSIIERT